MQLCELSLCLSVCLSVCLSFCLSVCPSVCLSADQYSYLHLYTHHSPGDVIYDIPIDTVVSGPNTSTNVAYGANMEVLTISNPAYNVVQKYGVWSMGYGVWDTGYEVTVKIFFPRHLHTDLEVAQLRHQVMW